MTPDEFSNGFDTLLNSYSVPSAFGYTDSIGGIVLDEYEKSVFLTLAQDQITVELYTGRNDKDSSFERTEELRSNLRSLIRTELLTESDDVHKGLSKYSKFFVLPKDVLFITYETATLDDDKTGCKNGSEITITPVTQDEFNRVMNNPFRQPSSRRALRLDNNSDIIEIVSKYNIKDYTIRYLSKPTPIILENLENLSINGYSEKMGCKLDSAVHMNILERAVALFVTSRGIQNKNNV